MILIDNNQLILSNFFQLEKQGIDDPAEKENMLLHMVLNSYRLYRTKFLREFGELVICHDSSNCWRKDLFPEYKANRKKAQKKSDVDWSEVHNLMDSVRSDIEKHLPYKNIKVDRAEADDIIYAMCKEFNQIENILIVSNDKDFQQLQVFPTVKQFSPTKKKYLVCEKPNMFLLDHIIRGDASDGVPNILSDDDVFVTDDKRQKRLTSKRFEEIYDLYTDGSDMGSYSRNWNRNETLIDLCKVPDHIVKESIQSFETSETPDRSNLLNYFIERKLKNLMGSIEEF
tara:strand:- start:3064 stop:3918 length:855 start_codon:yes stop_codon:yes gene_type:complete